MPNIVVYPDTFSDNGKEHHHITWGKSVHEWMKENVPAYDGRDLFHLTLDGKPFSKHLPVKRDVDLKLKPEVIETNLVVGTWSYVGYGVAAALSALSIINTLYSYYQYTQIPDGGSNFRQGSSIYDANVQGNQIRLFGTIPQVFGYHKVFPDIISAPWREYIDDDQWLHLLLCVGVGEYDIDADDIYIGNTPVSRYGSDVDYEIFGPSETVTGHDASRHMYTSREVGQTSSAAGVELTGPGETYGATSDVVMTWDFVGDTVTYNLNGVAVSVDLTDYDLVNITTSSGNNEGLYQVVTRADNVITVIRMLDEVTEDPDWGDSDASDNSFITESGVYAELEVTGVEGGWSGPYLATPIGETTDTLFVDFRLPKGLVGVGEQTGDKFALQIDYAIEYRDADVAGAWTSVTGNVNALSFNEIARTIQIDIGSQIRPEVRVRRTNNKDPRPSRLNDIFWVALRAELVAATSYADITTIGLSVRGTNAIAGSAENQFNIRVTRKIPEYDSASDQFGANVPTRDISAAFRYIINDINLTDSAIDFDELDRLHDIWDGRGDTFDGVFDQPSTFFEALQSVLVPGFAIPILNGNTISMVRDEPRTTYTEMYQPDNIIGGIQRSYQLINEDEHDGINVEYFSAVTWRPESILCLLDGEVGSNPETIRAIGITDETRAWRYGMRKRREKRFRRKEYTFVTELDALNSQFGNYVALGDDIPEFSQTGRVTAVDGRTLTLDREVEFTSDTQFIAIRRPDGTLSGPYEATATSEPNEVDIDDDLDFTPVMDGTQEPPLYQFGTLNRWTEAALIAEIRPQGDERVSVKAINYDSRVYLDDNGSPP